MQKTLSRSWKLFWIVWAIIAVVNIIAAYFMFSSSNFDGGIATGIVYSISYPALSLPSFLSDASFDENAIVSLLVIFSALFLCPALWAGMIVGVLRGGEKVLDTMSKK